MLFCFEVFSLIITFGVFVSRYCGYRLIYVDFMYVNFSYGLFYLSVGIEFIFGEVQYKGRERRKKQKQKRKEKKRKGDVFLVKGVDAGEHWSHRY